MCVNLQNAAHWRRRVRAIWGSSNFFSCLCRILEALMAEERKSSQKLWSPIDDPRMTKLGAFERVVIASWKPGKWLLQKKFTFAEVRKETEGRTLILRIDKA